MLSDQITIRGVFLKFPECQISIEADDAGDCVVRESDENDWGKESSYMEVEGGEYEEEIAYFASLTK